MVSIYYGQMEDVIYDPDTYFNNVFEEEWLDNELVKEMVKSIDKSIVLSQNCIESPVLGQIAPERLSGGVKALIIMLNEPETVFNASICGDNCAKWILEIGNKVDIKINLRHLMEFPAEEIKKYGVRVLNTKQVVYDANELMRIAIKVLGEERRRILEEL